MDYNIIEKNTHITGYGRDILYAEGKYFLVSKEPAKICYSEDLENWTEIQLNRNYLKPLNIAYGNGIFVVTGDYGTTTNTYIYVSNDGINWTPRTINTGLSDSRSLNNVKFCNNKFLTYFSVQGHGIGSSDWFTETYFFESSDGVNWKKYTHNYNQGDDAANYRIIDIVYQNNMYIAVGDNGGIFTSSSLGNMNRVKSGVNTKLASITYGKSLFVVVGNDGVILTSKDGKTWTKQETGTESSLVKSRYANGMYIAVGYNGTILQSIDGINWVNISTKTSGLMYGLTHNDERFVISATRYTTGEIPIFYFDVTREISSGTSDDCLFFYDTDFNLLGVLDGFISLRWRRKYFEAGEFEIVLSVTDQLLQYLNYDVLVMRNSYEEAGIIENIQFSDDGTNEEVIISGRFLSSILERRIIKNKINFVGNTIEGMNTLVGAVTSIHDNFEIETVSMSSPSIVFQCTYKNLYKYLIKLAQYSNIAFRVVPNVEAKVYIFEVWIGKDRTSTQDENERYAFSDDNYNIEQGRFIITNKNTANYALIGGEGEGENRKMAEITTTAAGFKLHEIFVDAKNEKSDGLSTSEYTQLLIDKGKEKLSNPTFNLELTATNVDDYKTKWDLGDIVDVKKEKWGVIEQWRIVEVEETIEDGKRTVYPTFGSPLFTNFTDDD